MRPSKPWVLVIRWADEVEETEIPGAEANPYGTHLGAYPGWTRAGQHEGEFIE